MVAILDNINFPHISVCNGWLNIAQQSMWIRHAVDEAACILSISVWFCLVIKRKSEPVLCDIW